MSLAFSFENRALETSEHSFRKIEENIKNIRNGTGEDIKIKEGIEKNKKNKKK